MNLRDPDCLWFHVHSLNATITLSIQVIIFPCTTGGRCFSFNKLPEKVNLQGGIKGRKGVSKSCQGIRLITRTVLCVFEGCCGVQGTLVFVISAWRRTSAFLTCGQWMTLVSPVSINFECLPHHVLRSTHLLVSPCAYHYKGPLPWFILSCMLTHSCYCLGAFKLNYRKNFQWTK